MYPSQAQWNQFWAHYEPWSPRRGSWPSACWPESQRCPLSPQPRPGHAAAYETCPGGCWPAPPECRRINNCCLCLQYMVAQKPGLRISNVWTYSLLSCPFVGFDLQLQLVYQILETSNILTILLSLWLVRIIIWVPLGKSKDALIGMRLW